MSAATWVAVLVKDFGSAKRRLGPALGVEARRELAEANARRAIAAARETGASVLAVAGSSEVATLAAELGVEVVEEAEPAGQNPAAAAGIARALELGAGAVLVLSSDLPLVTGEALREVIERGAALGSPVVLAAAAAGRSGTNALYLAPPGVVGLHFGDASLPRFEADARSRGVRFEVVDRPELALDLDEPPDLEALAAARAAG